MALYLHNPASQAHLHELQDRLLSQSACISPGDGESSPAEAEVERLLAVVRSMDKGHITTGAALEEFTRSGFPSFSKWLVDMVDEGVYLDARLRKAA